jgi:hypothetical protein
VSADLLAELTRRLAAQRHPDLSQRLCAAFCDITGAAGSSITLGYAGVSKTLLCATGTSAEVLEDLQDLVHEGPTLEAMRSGLATSLLPGPPLPRRWPLFVARLSERGLLPEIHVFPMAPQQALLGVLSVHGPTGFLDVTVDEAQFLANAVGVAVLGGAAEDELAAERWSVRDRVAQATGMVVAQLRLTPGDALAVLRAHAYAEDATLGDVSDRVVARNLRFTLDERGGST